LFPEEFKKFPALADYVGFCLLSVNRLRLGVPPMGDWALVVVEIDPFSDTVIGP
jgi:hypothetical protein